MKNILRTLLVTATLTVITFPAFAAEPKRVVVCTVTTGFRHSSIPTAEKTLQKLAEESKAFTIVDFARQPEVQVPKAPNKPKELKADADDKAKAKYASELKKFEEEMAKWTPEVEQKAKAAQAQFDSELKASLAKLDPKNLTAQKIDGVIFANTTGDLPLPDRDGFIKWVQDGHAFMGMHSASDTFHQFNGYLDLLQGEFAGHGAQVPATLIKADKAHPATAGQPDEWNLKQEEMYLIKHHDRNKLRALYFMRNHPNEPQNKGYFPVAWCRKDGNGRVFYTSLGHREDLWDADPNMKGRINSVEISQQYQAHILGGIKWALGLADGSAEPNPEAK
jgi:type 1 glutamine amidotransferase